MKSREKRESVQYIHLFPEDNNIEVAEAHSMAYVLVNFYIPRQSNGRFRCPWATAGPKVSEPTDTFPVQN